MCLNFRFINLFMRNLSVSLEVCETRGLKVTTPTLLVSFITRRHCLL